VHGVPGRKEKKKRKMLVNAKSLPWGNHGRNFAEHRGTADLLRAGNADVIISTVAAGSRAPGQAKELILNRGLCAIQSVMQSHPFGEIASHLV
jgi:hypothetical protein